MHNFVFVRQYRPGIERTCYELCAGVCEKEDASPLVSAQRELWEETGYGKGNWQEYMVISANPSTHTYLTYCFLATDVELIDHQHLEATEDITVHLLTLEEVRSLLDKSPEKQDARIRQLFVDKASRSSLYIYCLLHNNLHKPPQAANYILLSFDSIPR